MGRGVSCGGGQSSLGYLFGSKEGGNTQPPPENPSEDAAAATTEPATDNSEPSDDNTATETDDSSQKPAESYSIINQDPKPATDSSTNNYHRADGQNCGNFITDRPSTKVHAAPGGNSSLGYLFGDDKK
ncbi:protein SPIRAL1-like 1 [Bidens hawaiensis]|uniref:protein SPIRAL1-like 1 n=1 Tax=Bidens hawaiensis TaxID=980011 RepID=UPI004049EBC3